ncbi:MAG TPA: TIGR00266 family protein [Chloroflexota bacterium]|nr:TIGR00266 family protein [Chloroflexota bacterium]
MEHRIIGTTLPVLEITLERDERIVSEPGELSWMTSAIELRTSTQMAGSGGVFGVLKRAVAGGGIFLTEYSARGGAGTVSFATQVPGQILPVEIRPGQDYVIHRHGFLCGTPGIELSIAFQRSLGAGIFGGEGMILQKLSGTSQAWIELSGEIVSYDLKPGEMLRVHPGHVGMFEANVTFGITTISGIKNALFGGDGLFLATLTGPGKIWLQSAPVANLAHALQPYLRSGATEAAAGGTVAGAVLRDLLK